jgi:hypothetical protein
MGPDSKTVEMSGSLSPMTVEVKIYLHLCVL